MIIKSYEYEISFNIYSYYISILISFKIVRWETVNPHVYSLSRVGKRFLTAIQVRKECFGIELVNHTTLCHIAPPIVYYAESPTYQNPRRSSHEVSVQISICTDHQFLTKLILVGEDKHCLMREMIELRLIEKFSH